MKIKLFIGYTFFKDEEMKDLPIPPPACTTAEGDDKKGGLIMHWAKASDKTNEYHLVKIEPKYEDEAIKRTAELLNGVTDGKK